MDERLSEELATIRRVIEEQGRLLEARGRKLEEHFEGDEEFQGGLARDVREIRGSVVEMRADLSVLRTDFEKHKAGYEASQKRWRGLLDPEDGGRPAAAAPVKVELNGLLKQIVAAAAGAGGASWLALEAVKYFLQHWAGQ